MLRRFAAPVRALAHLHGFGAQRLRLFPVQGHFDQRAAIAQPCRGFRLRRLAYPQKESLLRPGSSRGKKPTDERAVAVKPVAEQQAVGGQASEQFPGQRTLALGQIWSRNGGGQRGVRARFYEHRATQLGKSGLETPAGGLGYRAEDARGVAAREPRAVDAHQSSPGVEGFRVATQAQPAAPARLGGGRQRLPRAWPDGVRSRRLH